MKAVYGNGVRGAVARAIDGAVDLVFPGWAVRRREARIRSAVMLEYDAAARKRTRRAPAAIVSADDDLLDDLETMRANARSMVRDDANAAALVQVLTENVVGTGITPQAMVRPEDTGMTDSQADEWNRACEALFLRWAQDEADATEHSTFFALQAQAFGELLRDGEHLSHRLTVTGGAPRELLSACEFIDVDRLQSPRGVKGDVRAGVEVGRRMQALAYWLTPRHPAERLTRYDDERLKKNEPERWRRFEGGLPAILHAFRRTRAGQRRGVPMFSASFGLVEALNDMLETEVVASRAASKICLLVKQAVTPAIAAASPGLQREPEGEWHEQLESGTIKYLNEGEDAQPFVPQRPGNTWEAFMVRVLRTICASFGLPYELVARDFARMNYSSARVALLEARRGFELWQQLLVDQFCAPWWRIVITEGVLRGILPAPRGWLQDPRPFLRAVWVPPSWGYVDPTKEIEASRAAVEANLSTPQQEAQRNGMDAETILEARARFLRKAREVEERYELPEGALTGAKPAAPAAPAAPPPGGEAGDGEQPQADQAEDAKDNGTAPDEDPNQ